ncbi:MAG: potassium channel protein [Saprospiraceae bacterium]|nr:potassium channel protein [Saprospiraceae bacterium]
MLPQYLIKFSGKRTKRFDRVNKYVNNLLLATLLLFLTILIGIIGYIAIDDYSFSEAFYMTIITLSTVGYGEVKPLSTEGQVFTSILIICNLGIFAYAISIISNFFIEGDLRTFIKHYKMYKKIHQMEEHTIICGYGKLGRQICAELKIKNMPFVVIENNKDKLSLLQKEKINYLEGDISKDDILIEAGIEYAKAIVITYSDKSLNVYTVLTAREFNSKVKIITRSSDDLSRKKLKRAGADHVVRTEVIGGFYMATLIHQPNIVEFFSLISNMGDVIIHFKEVEFLDIKEEYRNKTVEEFSMQTRSGVNIIGLQYTDGHYDINPKGDIIFSKGMKLVILGDLNQIELFNNQFLINSKIS